MKDLGHLPGRDDATSAVRTAEDLCNLLIFTSANYSNLIYNSICVIL